MEERALRIGIALSGEEASLWREPLARKLCAAGFNVGFLAGAADPRVPGVDLLERFERLIYRTGPYAAPQRPSLEKRSFDLIVTDDPALPAGPDSAILTLSCDGERCAIGAASAILDDRSPLLEARLRSASSDGAPVLARGRPAREYPHIFVRARDAVAERLADVAVCAVRRLEQNAALPPPTPEDEHAATRRPAAPLQFAANSLRNRVAERLARMAKRGARWRVAWRLSAGDEVSERGTWSAFAFHDLPDDGRRYFADPFVCAREGRTFVLCEEFPYETARGLLSVFEVRDGRVTAPPRPILETAYHLSYPMVFVRDGIVWMIPETCAANRIELWRAESFPDKWLHAGVLVDNVRASDATLLALDGRLWLFATVAEGGSSTWDCLHLWSADRLEGPWRAHPDNPVVIDASCARPAGMPFQLDGRWVRPVQDCSQFYGGGLGLCSIDQLDDSGFVQSLRVRLGPPPGANAFGVHTLNSAGNVEAIDLFGPAPARAARRADVSAPLISRKAMGRTPLT